MFYSIKIKSKLNEYSLESTDKEIIEREMDLYFASFFGASNEFRDKIIKIRFDYNDNSTSNKHISNNTKTYLIDNKSEAVCNIEKQVANYIKDRKLEENINVNKQIKDTAISTAVESKVANNNNIAGELQNKAVQNYSNKLENVQKVSVEAKKPDYNVQANTLEKPVEEASQTITNNQIQPNQNLQNNDVSNNINNQTVVNHNNYNQMQNLANNNKYINTGSLPDNFSNSGLNYKSAQPYTPVKQNINLNTNNVNADNIHQNTSSTVNNTHAIQPKNQENNTHGMFISQTPETKYKSEADSLENEFTTSSQELSDLQVEIENAQLLKRNAPYSGVYTQQNTINKPYVSNQPSFALNNTEIKKESNAVLGVNQEPDYIDIVDDGELQISNKTNIQDTLNTSQDIMPQVNTLNVENDSGDIDSFALDTATDTNEMQNDFQKTQTETNEYTEQTNNNSQDKNSDIDDIMSLMESNISSTDITSSSKNENLMNMFDSDEEVQIRDEEYVTGLHPNITSDEENSNNDTVYNNNEALLNDIFSQPNDDNNQNADTDLVFKSNQNIKPVSNNDEMIKLDGEGYSFNAQNGNGFNNASLQNSAINYNQQSQVQQAQPTSETPVSPSNTIDFKLFRAGFIINDFADDFIVCAYYIKNILNAPGFTMKFINSKLFSATGNFADMSVLQELESKGFIGEYLDENQSKQYTITPAGENYFIAKFKK